MFGQWTKFHLFVSQFTFTSTREIELHYCVMLTMKVRIVIPVLEITKSIEIQTKIFQMVVTELAKLHTPAFGDTV